MTNRTIASFPTQGLDSPAMEGEYAEATIRNMFAGQVSNISNMTAAVSRTTDAATGDVTTTYTFTPKVGNKG